MSKYKNLGRGIEAEHIPLPDEILKARDELRKAKSMGASVIPLCSSVYPKPLKEISNPPIVLYAKGTSIIGMLLPLWVQEKPHHMAEELPTGFRSFYLR